MAIDTGGPAFPHDALNQNPGGFCEPDGGMTLLDWFAGQALNAWVGSMSTEEVDSYNDDPQAWGEHQAAVATTAYGYAAKMVAEKRRLEGQVGEEKREPQ